MKFLSLVGKIKSNIFTFSDIAKYFPNEADYLLKTQISRFLKRRLIFQIKRGIYCFDQEKIDQLELAYLLYKPSYISLETALFYYGLLPDIPQLVTSVTPITTKKIKTMFGLYHFTKIRQDLFFAYKIIPSLNGNFLLAKKEKALLDYLYLRKLKNLDELRLDLKAFDKKLLKNYVKYYPHWVQKIKYE